MGGADLPLNVLICAKVAQAGLMQSKIVIALQADALPRARSAAHLNCTV